MLKLVKLQSLAAKCCKMRKIAIPNFVLICITCGKMHHIWAEVVHIAGIIHWLSNKIFTGFGTQATLTTVGRV